MPVCIQYSDEYGVGVSMAVALHSVCVCVCVSFGLARLIQRALGFTGLTGAAHLLQ